MVGTCQLSDEKVDELLPKILHEIVNYDEVFGVKK
jgi:hypothetical protein